MAAPSQGGQANTQRENMPVTRSKVSSRRPLTSKSTMASKPGIHQDLQDSMSRLNIAGPLPSETLNEQAKTNIKRAGIRLDDEQTHISSSSNKPPSLDGKSTTSGNTFALDEKESLRPDDSASAKAVEDDDSSSVPNSGAANSRGGSEAGSRAFREQLFEVAETTGHPGGHRPHAFGRRITGGIEEEGPQIPQTPIAASGHNTAGLPTRADDAPPLQHSMDILYHEPDEKLFDALESPKDRFFLLRLEEDIINFIKGSSEPKIELPPCNSFCRLLAHKLADYYALTHFVDNAVNSVTLYRTPYCRIPTPLSEIAKSRSAALAAVQPPAPLARKIMRRPCTSKDGNNVDSGAATTESSALPSKAGSEAGDDSHQGTGVASPTSSSAAKEKPLLTREEREARYKEKREELFGPQTGDADSGESTKEMSRTNSRNEKRKRKARRDDDGFEARSQFNAYYPGMPFPVGSYDAGGNPQMYFSLGMQAAYQQQQQAMMSMAMPQHFFAPGFQSMPPSHAFQGMTNQGNGMNGFAAQPQMFGSPIPQNFGQLTPTQYFAHIPQNGNMGQQTSAVSSPAMSPNTPIHGTQLQMQDQAWPQSGYGNFVPQEQQQPFFQQATQSVPYAYGQLPCNSGSQTGKPAHPVPGSYNRSAFNPQTRAFVPSGNSMPPQPGRGGNEQSFPNPHLSMMRSTSSHTSDTSLYLSNPMKPPQASSHQSSSLQRDHSSNPHGVHGSNAGRKVPNQASSTPKSSNSPAPPSSLSKWGTPANLPPKPPPPATPGVPNSLPMNNQFGIHVQAVNGGQPMPSFQNGVYSMPGVAGS